MDQALYTFFNLHERPEFGQAPNLPLDRRAHSIPLSQILPRVGQGVLQAERDAPLSEVDIHHRYLDSIALRDDL